MSIIQTGSKLRVPPHNTDIERAVLGTMLLSVDSIPLVLSKISENELYREPHRVLFSAIRKVYQQAGYADMVTVCERLMKEGLIDSVGGAAYMAELTSAIPSLSRIESYCSMLEEKRVLRDMITLSSEIADECFLQPDAATVTDNFGKRFFEIAAGKADDAQPVGDIVPGVIDNLIARTKSDSGLAGIPSGFVDLDKMLAGLGKSNLIIVAARPAMGKTAFAMNIARNVAQEGHSVAVFSLEMSRVELAERMLSTVSRVSLQSMRKGYLNDPTWNQINNGVKAMKQWPIIVDDTPALSITQLRARAKMLHSRYGLGLVIVDYLQLMRGTGGNREQEIADISRGLKALAKEIDVPVIALSQLNRSLESRTDKRPMMADLRESGAIEQDADVILFIYRDEVYNKSPDNPEKGIAEIVIGKQRSGPIGTVRLAFVGDFVNFENLSLYDE